MKKIGLLMMGLMLLAQAEFKRGDNDLTVIDTETKLEWQDSYKDDAVPSKSWSESIAYCEDLKLDSHDDWRLPNINELKSIVVETQYAPSIATGEDKFTLILNGLYWSSTKEIKRNYVWVVNFNGGSIDYGWVNPKYVRCVRDYK